MQKQRKTLKGGSIQSVNDRIAAEKGGLRSRYPPHVMAAVKDGSYYTVHKWWEKVNPQTVEGLNDCFAKEDDYLVQSIAAGFAVKDTDLFDECYTYVYADPRILVYPEVTDSRPPPAFTNKQDFMERYLKRAKECSLENFFQACFYVGEGRATRCFDHLDDPASVLHTYSAGETLSPALTKILKKRAHLLAMRILELWRDNTGPVIFVFDRDAHETVARTREAAIIHMYNFNQLANDKEGDVWVPWKAKKDTDEFAMYGGWLLRRAHKEFRLNPPLPIERL